MMLLVSMVCSISFSKIAMALRDSEWVAPREGVRLSSNMAPIKCLMVPPAVDMVMPFVLSCFLADANVMMSVRIPVPAKCSSIVLLGKKSVFAVVRSLAPRVAGAVAGGGVGFMVSLGAMV
ncbi:hypothetical protein C8R48DRAFT_690176, partial [Suillus tomentosus]